MPQAQQTYEITAPNGKVLSITGDHVPSEAELHQIFAAAGVETGAAKPPTGDQYKGPDTFAGGAMQSAIATIGGVRRGLLNSLIHLPRNVVMAPYEAPAAVIRTAQHPVQTVTDTAKAMTDPAQGGEMIGNLGLGLVAGRMPVPELPGGVKLPVPGLRSMVRTGASVMEKGPVKAAAGMVREWAEQPSAKPAPAPTPPATSPGASPSAAPPPRVPSPVAAAATAEADAAQQMIDQLGYSQSEAAQAVKWMKQRMPSELIWKRIQDARTLQQSGSFAKLPSNAEVDASVADRNATGRWPQDK